MISRLASILICTLSFTLILPWNQGVGSPNAIIKTFEARVVGAEVELSWTNSDAEQFPNFTIEKSRDGVRFSMLAKGHIGGSWYRNVSYTATDTDINPGGTYYYRFSMKKNDRQRISKTVAVSTPANQETGLLVFPNPVFSGSSIHIRLFNVPDGQSVSLVLINLLGKKVFHYVISGLNTKKTNSFDLPRYLSVGNYFLIASSRDGTYKHTRKLVIRKGSTF